ncbi:MULTISPECIES: hypothetical protein [unclassified Paenibacillus]|uniref:hypothetical protein n=1 Tax=unclassified Paenibacillus TaxID=185978 RepID=UPI00363BAE4F
MTKRKAQEERICVNVEHLNEMYVSGAAIGEMADHFCINESQIYEVIKRERKKNPDQWPIRKRRAKGQALKRKTKLTELQATYERPTSLPAIASPITFRQMTDEERVKYGVYTPPRDSYGELRKAPIHFKDRPTGRSSSICEG